MSLEAEEVPEELAELSLDEAAAFSSVFGCFESEYHRDLRTVARLWEGKVSRV